MLKPGMIISDRYEIMDKVGSGGMADVYKAKDQRLSRFVAIKVLKPEYSCDKSFVNKFRGEAQSAAGLSHPNIVNVYDVGDDSGLHYIVMEMVEGITLKQFIERKGKLEVKEAIGISIQIALGMEAAHNNHIIHRDIKPQNIIISREGKVKVTDFGIAKATNSNTITSNAMGSVHYLSPEQARGGYSDEKSDIYSLGVTMYEMLSGKVPFAGDNTVSVALLHIQGEAMPLRDLDPEIPVSVDKIVQKCMQKRPERRYHTASDLITDLKKAIANPDGNFVQIPAFMASDSPTINIGDDINKIKSGVYLNDDLRDTRSYQTGKLIEEDEEELDTVDSKFEKAFLVGTIAAAVILGLVIISLVIWFVSSRNDKAGNTKGTETTLSPSPGVSPIPSSAIPEGTYTIPDVDGYTEADARELILTKDPDAYITTKQEYSNTYEIGTVMKQYPQAGNEREFGGEIILTISTGQQAFELPDVSEYTEKNADTKLTDLGLKPFHDYADSDKIEEGKVISTTPEKSSLVKSGDTITVTVSTGPKITKVNVPNLIGSTQTAAAKALKDAGLALGGVTLEASDTYDKGIVSYQNVAADGQADSGRKVDIIVSTGPATPTNPPAGTYTYVGALNIDVNPFDYIGDGEAEIIIEIEQSGVKESLYEGMMSTEDFPYIDNAVIGNDASDATVRMIIDGDYFTVPGESSEAKWIVHFDTVEE